MEIKAIFMDLDGTALNSKHEVSELLKNKLAELKEKGVEIFVATGRMFAASEKYVKELGVTNPVINYNGCRITDPITKKAIYETPVEAEIIEKIIKIAREKNINLNLYEDDKLYIENEREEGISYAKKSEVPYISINFDDFIGKSSTKGLLIGDPEKLLELKNEVEAKKIDVNLVFSQNNYLEVLNKESNKGKTLLKLLEKYNISPEEAMAFGDQWNDLEMLKTVKYGYLMGNANDDLKKEFSNDKIILSNDEDGIYHIIKNI